MRLFLLVLAFVPFALCGSSVPSFSFTDVLSRPVEEIREVFATVGAFSLDDLDDVYPEYEDAVERLRKGAGKCFESSSLVHRSHLDDGSVRVTSATSSEDKKTHPDCVDTADIEEAFDGVQKIVHTLIERVTGQENIQYLTGEAVVPLTSAPHLDHIHVYEGSSEAKGDVASFPYHVDNGLFLIITPSEEQPLLVKDVNGKVLKADDDDVIILFGRAMTDWLLQSSSSSSLFATPAHSVPSVTEERTVYARMVVVQEDAIPAVAGKGLLSFGSIFHNTVSPSSTSLCPRQYDSNYLKVLQAQCMDGSEFCWMGCMPLAEGCPEEEQVCTNNEGTACCLEGQTPEADNCLDMDGSCEWTCPAKKLF